MPEPVVDAKRIDQIAHIILFSDNAGKPIRIKKFKSKEKDFDNTFYMNDRPGSDLSGKIIAPYNDNVAIHIGPWEGEQAIGLRSESAMIHQTLSAALGNKSSGKIGRDVHVEIQGLLQNGETADLHRDIIWALDKRVKELIRDHKIADKRYFSGINPTHQGRDRALNINDPEYIIRFEQGKLASQHAPDLSELLGEVYIAKNGNNFRVSGDGVDAVKQAIESSFPKEDLIHVGLKQAGNRLQINNPNTELRNMLLNAHREQGKAVSH